MVTSRLAKMAGPAVLFCPADRPERYMKALERADSVILDLEDAVSAERKEGARASLLAWCEVPDHRAVLEADPVRLGVRINPLASEHYAHDVLGLRTSAVSTVMLPKAESVDDIDQLVADLPGINVIALCETSLGVVRSREIAQHPATVAVMWGSEDLMVSLGGSSSRTVDGMLRSIARTAQSTVLLNAAAAGKPGIDTVFVNIQDAEGLAAEARDAAASGFAFKACIHPAQTEVVRHAYRPSAHELARARSIVAAVRESRGVVQFEGQMVDEPVIRHAERVLQRHRTTVGERESSS